MAPVILFLPLVGALFAGFLHTLVGEKLAKLFATICVFLSAALSWFIFTTYDFEVVKKFHILRWISSGDLNVSWSIRLDSLTAVMLVVVCSVSFLVHLYSFGYMKGDYNWKTSEKYEARFFSYLSFFTFTMLALVTSDNLLQMFFGWEGVGLASYLLIGFYYKKPSANSAAIKAFVVNRVGDFGFALGIICIFVTTGSLYFDDLFTQAERLSNESISFLSINFNTVELISFLLFIGAMGKSAQLFLHTWLPDAMEGPTPVSALIHAATMVTAGVFLVCRVSPLMEYSSNTTAFITVVGASTALFAASVALVQTDIKRVIAYSTCSQLGYMFAAAGIGFYQASMFHLFTHAFFKALLFLCAGSVIHSLHHEQDMRNYGGLRKKLPYTFIAMIIGTLAITGVGIPFSYDIFHLPIGFAGFVSKDAIIEGTYAANSASGLYAFWALIIAALFTSFYSWRLIFMTFFGEFRGKIDQFEHAHESEKTMLLPLLFLSLGSILVGVLFFGKFVGTGANEFFKYSIFNSPSNHIIHDVHAVPHWVKLAPFVSMVVGLLLAVSFYIRNTHLGARLSKQHEGLYKFLLNKWYFDECFNYLIVKPTLFLGDTFWKLGDGAIIDGLINKITLVFIPRVTQFYGKLQSGFLFHYAFGMILGATILITWFSFS